MLHNIQLILTGDLTGSHGGILHGPSPFTLVELPTAMGRKGGPGDIRGRGEINRSETDGISWSWLQKSERERENRLQIDSSRSPMTIQYSQKRVHFSSSGESNVAGRRATRFIHKRRENRTTTCHLRFQIISECKKNLLFGFGVIILFLRFHSPISTSLHHIT